MKIYYLNLTSGTTLEVCEKDAIEDVIEFVLRHMTEEGGIKSIETFND